MFVCVVVCGVIADVMCVVVDGDDGDNVVVMAVIVIIYDVMCVIVVVYCIKDVGCVVS